MKLSVRVRGEWFAIPCDKGNNPIRWLGEEALKRYDRLQPSSSHVDRPEKVYEIRKTKGGALLDPNDIIKQVLNDDDFVSVVLESDTSSPVLGPAEVPYVPEQIPGKFRAATEYVSLDGNSLSCDDLMRLGKGELKIKLTNEAVNRVTKARNMLEDIVAENKTVYGITTGFGMFARTTISKSDLIELQENLIRSHAAGVGPGLSPERTRALLALRINILSKGYSGISLKILQQLIDAFNESCLPWVPEKGTVGASGDLAPLAHLALGLMGEGKMWSPQSGWGEARYVLEAHGLQPVKLGPKEGIAMINGTQLMTALGVEAVERADSIARQADVVAALSLEVLKGTTAAFDSDIHEVRPHKGQKAVARRFRSLLHSETHPSEISDSHRFCNRVQDAYTLRCCPQVHGIVNDTIEFVRGVLTVEMNSATDNPWMQLGCGKLQEYNNFFPQAITQHQDELARFIPRFVYCFYIPGTSYFLTMHKMVFADRGQIISGGNFHGEYPAKVLDYLAIGVHELANISERRMERLVNPAYSELPAFLAKNGGLNSGFMLVHCTAAALVSENKVLCHPSSVDSLSTSGGTEDHVSMGGWSARKALRVVEHVEQVIAMELLAACQAIDLLRPLKTTAPLEEVYKLVRSVVKSMEKDHYVAPDIDAVTKLLQDELVWKAAKPYMDNYHSKQSIETRVFSPTTSYLPSSRPPMKRRRKTRSESRSESNM